MRFRQFMCVLIVVALVLPASLPLTLGAESQPTVVINELLWMGSPASSADEWIELRNMGSAPVDVSGWKLTRLSSGQEVTMLTIPAGKVIEPHGYFLVSNYSVSSLSSHLAVDPDVVDTAVSLLNSGLEVKLYDTGGVVVDVADDGSGTPLAGKYESGVTYGAMARNGIPGDGTKAERWHTATSSMNLKSGSLVLGTPRAQNDNVPPVVPAIPDQSTIIGATLTLDSSDAFDPDGDALMYAWDFGDGSTSDAPAPTHVYAAGGVFGASLEVRDVSASTRVTFSVSVTAPSESDPSPTQKTPLPVMPGTASLNELLPNPEGSDDGEFIELAITGGDADLSGWNVTDESGAQYVFPTGTIFKDHSFPVLDRKVSRIALNNNGDSVRLKKPGGTVVAELKYGAAEEGVSYAWDGAAWQWTTKPTPGSSNEIVKLNHAPKAAFSASTKKRVGEAVRFDASDSLDEDDDALVFVWEFGDGTKAEGRVVEHAYDREGVVTVRLTVRDARGLEDIEERDYTIRPPLKKQQSGTKKKNKGAVKGARIVRTVAETKTAGSKTEAQLTGWVSAPPHVLSEGLMYLTDGRSGIAVRSTEGFPELALGDGVSVRGARRTRYGEAYIAVERSGVKKRNGAQEIPMPQSVRAGDIDSEEVGALVTATGEVTTLSGNRFTIDDGSGELAVYIRASTGFKRPALRSGDRVTVSGILSKTQSGIRLLPRTKDDVRIVAQAVKPEEKVVALPPAKKPAVWMYVVVAGALVAGVGVGMWRGRA